MKSYTFPYSGSAGKCDSWDSFIDFVLTDEEAARLEASAKASPRWCLDEDEAISDIRQKIEQLIFEENKRTLRSIGRLEELRRDWLACNPGSTAEDAPPDDVLAAEEMGSWSVCYPEELQELGEEEE